MKFNVNFNALRDALDNMGGQPVQVNYEPHAESAYSGLEIKIEKHGSIVLTHEDLSQVHFDAGVAAIGGTQILLHIEQPYESAEKLSQRPAAANPKFHVTDCSTIQCMKAQGRYDSRYVAQRDANNSFNVCPYHADTGRWGEKIKAYLLPCINCIKQINFMRYNTLDNHDKKMVIHNFNIEKLFENYIQSFRTLPRSSAGDHPERGYTDDWANITNEYRESKAWICNCCKVSFNGNRGLLHTHHKNKNKRHNGYDNLESLCALCHKNQPGHGSMHIFVKDKKKICELREQQRNSRWCANCA